jgi:hypothetical protein
MNCFPRNASWIAFAFAAAFCMAGCHQKLTPTITVVSASTAGAQGQAPPDQGPDPAAANEAPSGAEPSGPSYTTQAPPPPPEEAGGAPAPDDENYAEQPAETAAQPPPPLPDYQQPPAPADGYIWEPGYWAWGPEGYYWVPGAWVEPPYEGALWTPGYWGFYGGRYLFYPGHWGRYIGFYGGINYGFGYFGLGYEGGYWRGGHFFYNRVYNRLNTRVVHNVYSYNAGNRGYYNRAGNAPRASFRGGTHGVQARPRPSDAAAWRAPTAPRMSTQVQHARSFQSNRGQYATVNHGRPATPAISRPIPADRNVRPTVPAPQGGGRRR